MSTSSMQWSHTFRRIELSELSENFNDDQFIGEGSFGKVYSGNITDGASTMVVAIKRMHHESIQGVEAFWSEVKTLSKLHHCNIVSLIGYCDHESEKILVYKYVPNGSLKDHLHIRGTSLSWLQRLTICISVGRGLVYLHEYSGDDSALIHGDLKSSNVLLQPDMAAKISDFGLVTACSKHDTITYVNTRVKGTFGYIDPNFFETGILRRKSDVYSFGVLLLEVLCRKPVLSHDNQYGEGESLVTWAQVYMKQRNFEKIIDMDIWDEISSNCLRKFISIVESCLHKDPIPRPTMAEVVANLESVQALQERYNRPRRQRFGCF